MDPICEVAAQLDLPILFHDGTPPYSLALQIAVLARRHPAVTMILGHGGLHDTWREALAALDATPNIWACLCGTPPYAAQCMIRHGPLDRIVVGTDAGLAAVVEQPYAAARVVEWGRYELSDAQRQAVLEDNPRRLLRIDGA
jgi:predicted TIM-barrel fold metal-dependent hydrolase